MKPDLLYEDLDEGAREARAAGRGCAIALLICLAFWLGAFCLVGRLVR